MKNVLIVDDNVGFLFWLGEILAGANYQPWPACSAADASKMLRTRHLAQLDLLVVNPSLRGATAFIARLRRNRPTLKVLAVDPLNDTQVRGVNAWHARPNRADVTARQQWLREVERIFSTQKRAA
jgi:DNA-binding response OmpR family regulator